MGPTIVPPTHRCCNSVTKKKGTELSRYDAVHTTSAIPLALLHPSSPRKYDSDPSGQHEASQVWRTESLPSCPFESSVVTISDFTPGASSAAVRPAASPSGHKNNGRRQEQQQHPYRYRTMCEKPSKAEGDRSNSNISNDIGSCEKNPTHQDLFRLVCALDIHAFDVSTAQEPQKTFQHLTSVRILTMTWR